MPACLIVNLLDRVDWLSLPCEPRRWTAKHPRHGRFRQASLTPLRLGWDHPTMTVTLDEKGRLIVPLTLTPTTPCDASDARLDGEEGAIVLRRIKRGGKSWLDILKACPVPIGDLPRRSREYLRKSRL